VRLVLLTAFALLLAGCASESGEPSTGTPTASSPAAATPTAATPAASTPSSPPAASTPTPASASPAPSGPARIEIQNYAFSPATLSVKTGAKVAVENLDQDAHTATAEDGSFDTGILTPDARSGEITAPAPGTYGYFCKIHPGMRGTLTVTA
jgi:plastocyanin